MLDYKKYGFNNRREYLMQVAVDHNVPFEVVRECASRLGKKEDFDGLIQAVEDMGL
jgi:hypothetical protein